MVVGEGREQEALSFTNFRNSSLLRTIRCLESDIFEYEYVGAIPCGRPCLNEFM